MVLGRGGMLGRATVSLLGKSGLAHDSVDYPAFDLTDAGSIERAVRPGTSLVINCAAYTDVDGAEADPAAERINARGVEWLARRCAETGATLVHYSTDYVFNGASERPYRPDQPRQPLNRYGVSKAKGEEALERSGASFLLLRTSWLYAPWGKNFVRTIAKLAEQRPSIKVVNDQRGRPTSAEHLARTTLDMLRAGARGTHHATDGGECSWFEFACAIIEGLGLPCRVEPCTSAEFPRPAIRPAYSVLDLTSTESIVGPREHWRTCLNNVLTRLERPL